MNKNLDFDKLRESVLRFSQSWQKKLGYLSELVSRLGLDGISLWLKSHHQIEALQIALDNLLTESENESFTLLQVEVALRGFEIPEEDREQLEWYKTAHCLLQDFEKLLVEKQQFDKKKLQAAQNELKFISLSDEFHQRYSLQPIQKKVTKVYQSLQQVINEHNAIEKEKLELKKTEDKLKLAQLETEKAQAEAKKLMMQNVKIKEKRIAIIEERKKNLAQKALLELQEKQQKEEVENQAKQAEIERQSKLQDAYIELQLEETIANWKIGDYVDKFTYKLEHEALNDEQLNIVKSFIDYLRTKSQYGV